MDTMRVIVAAALFVAAIVVGRNSVATNTKLAAAADAAGVLAYAALDNITPAPPQPQPEPDGGDAGSKPAEPAPPAPVKPAAKATPTGCYVTPDGRTVCPTPQRQGGQYYRRGIFPLFR